MFKQIHMVHKPGKYAVVLAVYLSVVLKSTLFCILISCHMKMQMFTKCETMNQIKRLNWMVDSDAERQLEAVYLYWVYFVLLKIKKIY